MKIYPVDQSVNLEYYLKFLAIHYMQEDGFAVSYLPKNPMVSACESGHVPCSDRPILQIATTGMYNLYKENPRKAKTKAEKIKQQFLNLGKHTTCSPVFERFIGDEDYVGMGHTLHLTQNDDPDRVIGTLNIPWMDKECHYVFKVL